MRGGNEDREKSLAEKLPPGKGSGVEPGAGARAFERLSCRVCLRMGVAQGWEAHPAGLQQEGADKSSPPQTSINLDRTVKTDSFSALGRDQRHG